MDKILVISHLFPNNVEYSKGIFVFDQVKTLSKLKEIKVISPIMWLPFFRFFDSLNKLSKVKHKDLVGNVEIRYPRCFPISLRVRSTILMFIAGVLYFISVYLEILKISKRFKFNTIHSHFVFPDGFSSVLLGRILKKPVIITVHGSDVNLYTEKMDYLKPLVIYSLKNTTHIVAVSTDLKNKMIKLGIPENKISVVYNGYNSELFRPISKDEARRNLSLPLDKKIVLFVGNLVPAKGVMYLIEAMKIISKLRDDTILVVVGDGYLKSQLISMVQEYKLSSKIYFVGSQPHEKIPLWMNACDLLALPSISEGFGAVLIEAAACGKPIVATDVGGIPEASLRISRKLVPPKDPDSLSKSMLEVLNSNFDHEVIIRENKRFDINNIADQLIKIYDNVE